MVVSGLPTPQPDHLEVLANMALDMQAMMEGFHRNGFFDFKLRIGINTGPVVAGIIGFKKFSYDLWGDTVNVASRMESLLCKSQAEGKRWIKRAKQEWVEEGVSSRTSRDDLLYQTNPRLHHAST